MIFDAGAARQVRNAAESPTATDAPKYHPPMRLTVNGRSRQLDVAADATLLSVLRDQLHLTGAQPACERGECGARTVRVDGPDGRPEPIYACIALARAYESDSITTIEGLSNGSGPNPGPAAFILRAPGARGFVSLT